MPMSRSLTSWLRLPSRLALILGLGALSTAGAQAEAPDQSNLGTFGDISIRSDGGKIYLSESGGDFQELQLRDTAEARHLKWLLEQNGTASDPAGLRLNPTILAGGGGTGFSLWEIKKSLTDKPAPTPQNPPQGTAPQSVPERESASQNQNPTTEKKE
jgi:hypothetical protein